MTYDAKTGRFDNPFAASNSYRPLSAQKAKALIQTLDPMLFAERTRLGRVLPQLGHEVGLSIEGKTYWPANEGGTYYFKHPDYLKEAA